MAVAAQRQRFLPAGLPTSARQQAAESRERLAARLGPLAAARRGRPDDGLDMLRRLVNARDPQGASMTDDEIVGAIATLYFGGTETSASALSFAVWLLGHRPDLQDALAEERAAVLGSRPPCADDARALVRHQAVLDEAMRLYPPVWALGRRVLRPIEVAGRRLEPGDQLNASPWVVHRDPRWYDRPLAFRPERFLGAPARPRPRLAYFPYGAGPRTCIGGHFGRMETLLVLTTWLASV